MSPRCDTFHTTRGVLLEQNPNWCYLADADIVWALMDVQRPELLYAVRHLSPNTATSRLHKHDMIVHDFVRKILTQWTLRKQNPDPVHITFPTVTDLYLLTWLSLYYLQQIFANKLHYFLYI